MPARFCHHCGNPLPENAKFCGNCGTPVSARPSAPAPVVIPVTEPEPEPIPAPQIPEEAPVTPAPATVFTLDSLDAPVAPPAPPVKPVIFSLDSLTVDEAPAPEPEQPAPQNAELPQVEEVAEPEQIPEPEPAPPEKKSKPKKEKKAKKEKAPKEKAPKEKGGWPSRSAGRTVLAVLLCILIFLWSFSSLTLLNARLATTGEQGEKTLTAVIRSLDLTKISASVLTDDLQDPKASLADWVVGKITENYQGRVDLNPEDLKEFWEDSAFPAYLVTHLSNCLTDIYTGSSSAKITAEDILLLLQTDAAVIDEVFDEQLSEADMALIATAAVDSGALELLSTQSLKANAGGLYNIVQIGLSWWVIGITAVILVLLVVLLGKINGSVLRTFGDTGITLMVMSAIWCVGGLLILAMPDLWNAMFYQIRPVGAAIGSLLTASLIPSGIVFGVGALLLLIKVIGKTIVIKSAKAQA